MSALSRFGASIQALRSPILLYYPSSRHMASASVASDPVQKLFVEKIREFKTSNKGLDEAHVKAQAEDMLRLKRVYQIQDEKKLSSLEYKFSNEHQVSLHDLDETKEHRQKINSGEYYKQVAATSKEESALLASIPEQVTHDLHLPPMNKPDARIILQSDDLPIPVAVGPAVPDYERPYDKVTPDDIEKKFRTRFGPNMPTIHDDKKPERDLVNFPRRPIPMDAPPTRYHFIPESWFQFFYPKTGVTGPYAFAGAFTTFLLSKEWLIWEHELLTGVTSTIIFTWAIIKFGPKVGTWGRKKVKDQCDAWEHWRTGNIKTLEHMQEHYRNELKKAAIIKELYTARRQDVDVQLEGEYRNRLKTIYQDTRRRLDYLVAVADSKRQIAHNNMVNWVIGNVVTSIGPKQESELLDSCIVSLKDLANKNANAI